MREEEDLIDKLQFEQAAENFYLAENADNSESWGIAKTVGQKSGTNQWIGFVMLIEPDIRGTLHLSTFKDVETATRIMTAIHFNGGTYSTLVGGDDEGLIDRVCAADFALSSFVLTADIK